MDCRPVNKNVSATLRCLATLYPGGQKTTTSQPAGRLGGKDIKDYQNQYKNIPYYQILFNFDKILKKSSK